MHTFRLPATDRPAMHIGCITAVREKPTAARNFQAWNDRVPRRRHALSRLSLRVGGAILVAACVGCRAPVSSSPEPTISPVSISNPNPGAKDAFEKCHIGDMILIEKVAGMGQIPSAKDLLHYVPLTGREPQLQEESPAWVIQIKGEVQQFGNEIWIDPICIVTANDHGFYATGPVKNTETGQVLEPEPPSKPPDRTLPRLVP
jgi:hypothetical protein